MTQTTRGMAVSLLKGRPRDMQPATDSDWADVKRRIDDGSVVPLISNSLRYDAIFAQLLKNYNEAAGENDCDRPHLKVLAENLLAQAWAEQIAYPLPDTMELARVAQFNRSLANDDEEARVGYLNFLKNALLGYAENLGADSAVIDDQFARIKEISFADIVQNLGYPLDVTEDSDPLRVLARQRLPMYVTTDYHDFIERALILEGKQPVTQLSQWAGELNLAREHVPDPTYVPTPERPLVYHVFGLERYPKSMVLSEDDYIDFLVKVNQSDDANDERAVIPFRIRSVLKNASLIVLGYRLQDWDFRVLFRGIVNRTDNPSRGFSLIIQLTPDQQYNIKNPADAQRYLEKYFRPKQFSVAWGGVDSFLKRLMGR